MKTLYIILTIIALALCVFAGTLVMELRKENGLKQSEIDGLRKKNIAERDSLESQLSKTRDSLNIAFETIRQAKAETLKANEASKREIRKLKGIIFISHNDSSRNAELHKLYPSWNELKNP